MWFWSFIRILHGHRPYWWIPQNQGSVKLSQTEISCETGPGNPSGHVMINVVTYLTFLHLMLSCLNHVSQPVKLVARRMLWNVVLVMTAIMITSRVYILAHFPHQCILAVLFGYVVYHFSSTRIASGKWNLRWKILVAFAIPVSSLLLYVNGEKLLGFQLDWSLRLASKFCSKVKK